MAESSSKVKDLSDGRLKMMKVYYKPWRSKTHSISLNNQFTLYAPNIGRSRPKTTSPYEEEHIWPHLRMNSPFTGTKDGTSAQSDGTPILTLDTSDWQQVPTNTACSWTPSTRTSNINNRISMSNTRHRT